MLPSLAGAVLQAAGNATAAQAGGAPLWLAASELAAAIAAIVVVGSLATRVVRKVALKAGAPKSVATSVTEWMGVLTLIGAVAAVTTFTGLSSQLTALTLSGIAGLAVSLALQSTISNVISGVLMQHDGVIRLGDDVQYTPGGVRGEVVKLSLRSTWLKTKDGVVVVISNSILAAGPILNYTSLGRLQRELEA
jgi:small conductance mechanosensitive channel